MNQNKVQKEAEILKSGVARMPLNGTRNNLKTAKYLWYLKEPHSKSRLTLTVAFKTPYRNPAEAHCHQKWTWKLNSMIEPRKTTVTASDNQGQRDREGIEITHYPQSNKAWAGYSSEGMTAQQGSANTRQQSWRPGFNTWVPMVEGENWFLKVVLCPLHTHLWTQTCIQTHTFTYIIVILDL